MDDEVTVQDNWYIHLGVRLGASLAEVQSAYDRIMEEHGARSDEGRLAKTAFEGLTHPERRLYHDQQIKWDAAGKWYRKRHPEGADRSAEHAYWSDFRRRVYGDSSADKR